MSKKKGKHSDHQGMENFSFDSGALDLEEKEKITETFYEAGPLMSQDEKKKNSKKDILSLIAGVVIGVLLGTAIGIPLAGVRLNNRSEESVAAVELTEEVAAETTEPERAEQETTSEEVTVEKATIEAKENEQKEKLTTTVEQEDETSPAAIGKKLNEINRSYSRENGLRDKLELVAEEALWVKENPDLFPEGEYYKAEKNPDLLHFLYSYGNNLGKDPKSIIIAKTEIRNDAFCFYQWDARWGYHPYGSSVIAITGCGPTCMAMVVASLLNDTTVTPSQLADYAIANDLYSYGAGTKWEFMSRVADEYHLSCEEISYNKENLFQNLEDGKLLIAVVGEGHFTTDGHFIVIVGEKNGKLIIHDPNNYENSHVLWDYDVIVDEFSGVWAFGN